METVKDKTEYEQAVLVGIDSGDSAECEISVEELRRLLDTAGGCCAAVMIQQRRTPDPKTCIGSGKLKELKDLCKSCEAKLCVFDCELSPSQIRNIEDALDDVSVIDRSMLILDIFAAHAVTAEGKLQVALAQLKYTAPRLIGKGKDMSRLGGGIGTRGPGESQLETDRRHLKRREASLTAALRELETQRRTTRSSRDRSGIPRAAIVGYTNAGKSTLLNRLTDAGILAEDKLFATLDPTTRKFTLPGGEAVLLTDTVGFIRNLPHHLIKAFSSTLEEAATADIVIIVVDASDPDHQSQLAVTRNLLEELGAGAKPTLIVYNKCDCRAESLPDETLNAAGTDGAVFISALTGDGIDSLTEGLTRLVRAGRRRETWKIPQSEWGLVSMLYRDADVESVDYGPEFITVTASADARVRGLMAKYRSTSDD